MLRKKRLLLFLGLMTGAMLLTACSAKTVQEPKAPATPQTGIIDMGKAIKAHPKYKDYEALTEKMNTLSQELQAQQQEAVRSSTNSATRPEAIPESALAGLNEALSQEFNAKMAAKQAELQTRLDARIAKARNEVEQERAAYIQELDEVYQPQIFSLQLKLKTLQLSKEESVARQAEMEKLQSERAAQLSAKEQELGAKLNGVLAPEHAAMESELTAYAGQLNEELARKGAEQSAAMGARLPTAEPQPKVQSEAVSEIQKQLGMRQQEMNVLQEFMLNNIKDKTAKIAAERGMDVVLTNVKINISGVDITSAVIAEFNK